MRVVGNYENLLDSFEVLKRSLKQRRSALLTVIKEGVPKEPSGASFETANAIDCASLAVIEKRLQAASARYSQFAKALADDRRWWIFDASRPAVRGLCKMLGFDARGRRKACEVARAELLKLRAEIEARGMRPSQMEHHEFDALARKARDRWTRSVADFAAATHELETIEDRLRRLKSLDDAVRSRTAALHGLRFAPGYEESVRDLLHSAVQGDFDAAFRLLESLPVRVLPSENGRADLRSKASEIVARWNHKGLYSAQRNQAVAGSCVTALRAEQMGEPRAETFDDIRPIVSEIGTLRLDVQAALYWIGSAAEHAELERVPRIAKEEHYNSGLVREVEGVVEKIGYTLFQDLGYTSGFPFEVAFWETDPRDDEADTGADMCIILHVVLENNVTMTRGALLQGKRAKVLKGEVHRTSTRLGRNHQLISLTSGKAIGYYLFYHHPYETLGVSVVPAETVKSTILASAPSFKNLWEIPPSACSVASDKNGTDFASFLAFTLMDAKHHFASVEQALLTMGQGRTGYEKEEGEDVVEELASKLAVVTIGGAMPDVDLEVLAKYGYKATDRRERLRPPSPWDGKGPWSLKRHCRKA
ncbi:hypothetical protein J2S28_005709 [Rhizobium sp. SLBN-94]|nr:hypothetical protein [Rhizobium sp. SLBN-94]